ncbi:MAG: cobalt transporter [Actinobacteria bacterium 13_1_20CM_3_71_11]|nr:MAG: cobalt transporter [Actinobacteria bacterium 13_1_20CM_3_71_11]
MLARRNPVAKLAAALVPTLALLSTLDPLTPALFLAVELALVPLFGMSLPRLARRGWPLLVTAAGVASAQLLFTTGGLAAALGIALRIPAVALPGIVVFATTDPTDLADALVQNVRLPARFAIGALAAFRLVPLLGEEWRVLALARRARGIDAGRNPYAHLRLAGSLTFGLLVGAIRRGTRLATAMDARGFDSGAPRTFARVQRFRTADTVLVLGSVLMALALGAVHLAY